MILDSPIIPKLSKEQLEELKLPLDFVPISKTSTIETDDQHRANLLIRKGWRLRPDPPEYDSSTQTLEWISNSWVVTPKPKVVPQEVTRRQAKTIMQLTPYPGYDNLWDAAIAAANSIEDTQTRIVITNYIMEALYFEYPKVVALSSMLLNLPKDDVDNLFIAAAEV